MMRQMANISFGLKNLKEGEKVLCFTQNQIFFDPVFKINWTGSGKSVFNFDATYFEQRMINEQSKVIINDYRTRLLNKEVKKKIEENYLPIQTGDILIPGFKVEPKNILEKKIWIEGYYYSPTLSLEINGKRIESNFVRLKQERYRFKNNSNRYIFLVYIFNKEKFLEDSSAHPQLSFSGKY